MGVIFEIGADIDKGAIIGKNKPGTTVRIRVIPINAL
jgi:hypothetical protein